MENHARKPKRLWELKIKVVCYFRKSLCHVGKSWVYFEKTTSGTGGWLWRVWRSGCPPHSHLLSCVPALPVFPVGMKSCYSPDLHAQSTSHAMFTKGKALSLSMGEPPPKAPTQSTHAKHPHNALETDPGWYPEFPVSGWNHGKILPWSDNVCHLSPAFPLCLPFEIHVPVLFTEKKGRDCGFRD